MNNNKKKEDENPQVISEENKFLTEAIEKLDKEIFFTASSAKSKTLAVHKKKLEVDMLPIYQKINEAINAGKYTIEAVLTSEQKDFLYAKNFRITWNGSSTYNGITKYNCIVYWD